MLSSLLNCHRDLLSAWPHKWRSFRSVPDDWIVCVYTNILQRSKKSDSGYKFIVICTTQVIQRRETVTLGWFQLILCVGLWVCEEFCWKLKRLKDIAWLCDHMMTMKNDLKDIAFALLMVLRFIVAYIFAASHMMIKHFNNTKAHIIRLYLSIY